MVLGRADNAPRRADGSSGRHAGAASHGTGGRPRVRACRAQGKPELAISLSEKVLNDPEFRRAVETYGDESRGFLPADRLFPPGAARSKLEALDALLAGEGGSGVIHLRLTLAATDSSALGATLMNAEHDGVTVSRARTVDDLTLNVVIRSPTRSADWLCETAVAKYGASGRSLLEARPRASGVQSPSSYGSRGHLRWQPAVPGPRGPLRAEALCDGYDVADSPWNSDKPSLFARAR